MDASHRAAEAFARIHHRPAAGLWSAPGRVNLIGEHTDYNDGLVLPFALPHRTAVAAAVRTDGVLTVTTIGSDGKPQQAKPMTVAELAPGAVTGWVAYPCGVVWSLVEHGVTEVRAGADLVIASDVPAGAGLSSSAALECAVALALVELFMPEGSGHQQVDRRTLATWAQFAENEFVGAPTGVLDQTASLCCAADHVLFLDVQSGVGEQVPFHARQGELRIIVVDTRVNHALGDSAYGQRRRGCERAARRLGARTLRDLQRRDLTETLTALPAELRPLVRHVISENERVSETVSLLRTGLVREIGKIGALLTASHASLRDDYRVSAPELDVAVDTAVMAGALGARMTGGGFGGSAIALVAADAVDTVENAVMAAFRSRSFIEPRMFTTVPSAGAMRER